MVMLERKELLRMMVLDFVCDLLENVDQCIFPELERYCAKLGWRLSRSEVVEALANLVGDGLVSAYRVPDVATELEGMPSLDVPEDDFRTYFFITSEGMKLHQADDSWWPFDDDGNPLP